MPSVELSKDHDYTKNPRLTGETPSMDLPREFVQQVMEEAARYSGLPLAPDLPNIVKTTSEEFELVTGTTPSDLITAGAVGKVTCKALYTVMRQGPKDFPPVLMVHSEFNPDSPDDHGVLLHELVHHLQWQHDHGAAQDAAKFAGDLVLADARTEVEAYEAQLKYYAENAPGVDASGYENALVTYKGTMLNCLQAQKHHGGNNDNDAEIGRLVRDIPVLMAALQAVSDGSFSQLCHNAAARR